MSASRYRPLKPRGQIIRTLRVCAFLLRHAGRTAANVDLNLCEKLSQAADLCLHLAESADGGPNANA